MSDSPVVPKHIQTFYKSLVADIVAAIDRNTDALIEHRKAQKFSEPPPPFSILCLTCGSATVAETETTYACRTCGDVRKKAEYKPPISGDTPNANRT